MDDDDIVVGMAVKLLDRVREAIRTRHYSRRTEDVYVHWIRRYIVFHGKAHPSGMGAPWTAASGMLRDPLLHGDQDVDVPIEMSARLAAILERRGVSHEFIRLEGFNPGFSHAQWTFQRSHDIWEN